MKVLLKVLDPSHRDISLVGSLRLLCKNITDITDGSLLYDTLNVGFETKKL